MRRALFSLVCLLLPVRGVCAQETARLEARVLAVSGTSVYLDRGREGGVEREDPVFFHPPGVAIVSAVVRDVSKRSSRAEVPPGSPRIVVGTRAEIRVPSERLEANPTSQLPQAQGEALPPPAPASRPAPPPAPSPWTHPPENWKEDMPLLAPAFGSGAQERPVRFSGRVFGQGTATWDRQGDNRRYFFGTLGTGVRLENLLGRGGSLDIEGEVFRRVAILSGDPDERDTTYQITRFSYSEGGTPEVPLRWEVGRFLQDELPELGLVDGAEVSYRFASGSVLGASGGWFPEPFPGFDSSEDVQATLYYRWSPDPDERLRIGAAYQNSWHEGDQDRNLVLATLDYDPGPSFSFRSAAWIDYYGSSDSIKDEGFQLTEFQGRAAWRHERIVGLGLSVYHRRIPELLRREFATMTPEEIRDDRLQSVSLDGFFEAVRDRVRLDASVSYWRDQDEEGPRGEVGVVARDLLFPDGEVAVRIFATDGIFEEGEGFRVSARKDFGRGSVGLGYAAARFEGTDSTGGGSDLLQQAIQGSLDFRLGALWDLSLLAEERFGDEQDSTTVALFLQARF
jgi:hypothetical protein